jgi:O-antigen ligase
LPSAWEDLNLSHPHNIVLDALTRLGAIGLVAAALLVAAVLRRLIRLSRRAPAGRQELFIGLLGRMAAALAHGLIDNSLFLVDLALVFMMTAGLAMRWSAPAEEKIDAERGE